ncbi:hypothetical protein NA56DRAFT_651556 [Hyaloscypha hepaticicola]|uniref:Uncharacterized protein n=1 Tax=Hyaloscypha hepaticicola TaxID=2082293 RepID=A0A2J6PI83_9HELO|nr:hypothetical protein NA56DRAFT_651556 [Hyaloscypha hepaticicola]
MARYCRAPKKSTEEGKSPNTGPLPTLSGGRGLLPGPKGKTIDSTEGAKSTIEYN